jgi:hypothetical protein
MSEQITITLSLRQAEAIVDAANCAAVCADGELTELFGTWIPKGEPDTEEADRHIREHAACAREVADMLEPEVEDAYKRDPTFQQAMHTLKMLRKHDPEFGALDE